ncbi:hypothetical protein ABKV19_013694 [Rosa sericea]
MSEISGCRSLSSLLLLGTIFLQFIPGFSDDGKNSTKPASHATSRSSNGSALAFIPFGLVVVGLLSFFLFKLWQKKKREEQYARLLKLFEEDDELELELGLRD